MGTEGRCWGQINASTRCVICEILEIEAQRYKDSKATRQSYITAHQSQLDSEPEGGCRLAAFICRQKMQSDRPARRR